MNNSVPPPVRSHHASEPGPGSGRILKALNQPLLSHWTGWRLRVLVVLALAGCTLVFLLARSAAMQPYLGGDWVDNREGRIELRSTEAVDLKPYVGKQLVGVSAAGIQVDLQDAALVQRSVRWLAEDAERSAQRALHLKIAQVSSEPRVTLTFEGGAIVQQPIAERNLGHLGAGFWLLTVGALALYLAALVVLLFKPSMLNVLYASMSLAQVGNLAFAALESALDLGVPAIMLEVGFTARAGFDVITAASIVHAVSLHPLRLPHSGRLVSIGWLAALGVFASIAVGLAGNPWLLLQSFGLLMGLTAIAMLTWSRRLEPWPLTLAMRRFGVLLVGTWALLTLGMLLTRREPWLQASIATVGPLYWYSLLAGVLLLTPFVSRSLQYLREFELLAAISAFATVLYLLFIGASSLSEPSSGAISGLIAAGVYLAARRWSPHRPPGARIATTERVFEQLHRVAREVESEPDRAPALLAELLRELFEPVEIQMTQDLVSRTRITSDGSTMLVPVPALAIDEDGPDAAIVLRFAQRGNRVFTLDDTRLTDRIVEQIQRAVAYDRAVERGRGEERLRLAQDLHDDIGARLLTLIYKAQSPEMADYARRTLQDLKTLTRGLAVPNRRLSHAAAEWKADLAHRLSAANIEFGWSCEFDNDVILSVVQWSAWTRVLRELVSNAIAHSAATRVEVTVRLDADRMMLSVCDDGGGRDPKAWSHGLGLGGVRKRVKQLGGQVEWSELTPRGICCRVIVNDLSCQR